MNELNDDQLIKTLTQRFQAHQSALGLSDGQFAGRYQRFLGSEKTWTLLKRGEWEGHVKPERILKKLRGFSEQLDGALTYTREDYIPSMPFARMMDQQYERLLASGRDRRCLIALAPEGIGKSWWASARIEKDKAHRCFYKRLNHTWREKSFHLSAAICETVGGPRVKNPAIQMDELKSMLKGLGQCTVIIDEGHNGGIVLFKMMKDLIDETPVRFVYLAFPTEYDAIISRGSGAVAEARQLIRRCIRPICDDYRFGIGPADVREFLAGNGFKADKELREVADLLAPKLMNNQNISTLADALDAARDEAEETETELTLAMVTREVDALTTTAAQRLAARKN
jgi:hypothetical protein